MHVHVDVGINSRFVYVAHLKRLSVHNVTISVLLPFHQVYVSNERLYLELAHCLQAIGIIDVWQVAY